MFTYMNRSSHTAYREAKWEQEGEEEGERTRNTGLPETGGGGHTEGKCI